MSFFFLSKLGFYIILCELLRLGAQQRGSLLQSQRDLVAHGHQAFGQVHVVFLHQLDRQHDVVDIPEHQSVFGSIAMFLLQESDRVFTPVSSRIEVVRGVVAIIIAEPIALDTCCQLTGTNIL